MDNAKLKLEKIVGFLGIIFDHKITFEEHIKDEINNTRQIPSSFYSLKSKKYRIPEKTKINLYKIFIRPNFKYGNTALITADNKYIYKWEKIQMNVLRSIFNLNRNMNNDVVRKCANISSISERIKQLAKSWYKKLIITTQILKNILQQLKHL